MTRTKIVCTIGPACWDEDNIRKLIENGMDVARLNFSHGSHESHREIFNRIRRISVEMETPIAIMQDLCGPKIRLGEIPDGPYNLEMDQRIILTGEDVSSTPEKLHVSHQQLAADLRVGEPVLINDGIVQLVVEEIKGNEVICRVTADGEISSHKGVNLPESDLNVSALTEKDFEDVKFGMELEVDLIALSFVRKADDINELKHFLDAEKKFIPIIAKIEKKEAVKNLEAILTAADGAMVARGDLGVEIPIQEVPHIQKKIIHRCNQLSKPVITATQMLDSMIRNPIPTRAEASDIANAILDGTDAVMLSGETASGKYPQKAIEVMDRIAFETEKYVDFHAGLDFDLRHDVVDSISLATCQIAEELGAKAIIVLTDSGRTARLVSRYKPNCTIIAVTTEEKTVRRLQLSWGVIPLLVEKYDNTDSMLSSASEAALKSGLVSGGDLVVTTAGIPAMVRGSTNMIKVDVLGHTFLRGTGVGKKAKLTGKVCNAITAEDAAKTLEVGDILITHRMDDSFIPIANRLGGLVVEEGTTGSYADYFCSRFDIPGILGVPGVTNSFFTGRIVTLDTDRGIIFGAKT